MCIRGTRTPFNSSSVCQESSLAEDFLLNSATADIASQFLLVLYTRLFHCISVITFSSLIKKLVLPFI